MATTTAPNLAAHANHSKPLLVDPTPGNATDNTAIDKGSTHRGDPTSPVVHFFNNSTKVNGTAQPVVGTDSGGADVPGAVIGLMLGLLAFGIVLFLVVFYLKRTGKLYHVIPFKRLATTRERRSSTTDSRHPLDGDQDSVNVSHADEISQLDTLPRPIGDATTFTIDDFDTETVDLDTQSRGTNDEYYYDEVFGKSVFEDEETNASMRELYLARDQQDDDDMFDVDTILKSITEPKVTKT